jgi:chemotaxis protein methyltransferase CheR
VQQKNREFLYTREDFNVLRKLSNEHSGIIVSDDKYDMFYSRLAKRLRGLKLSNFKDYCRYIEENSDQEFCEFINAITTNLTAFFRENHHFEYLRSTVIPEILTKNSTSRRIRVWSAGCSTGEEPYSIAMMLLELVPKDWDIKILATDLDTQVLTSATAGVYTADRVEGIDLKYLKRWFKQGKNAQQNRVIVAPELKQIIHFKQLNLMGDWPMKGPFDFIFCRNVIIYFDRATKQKLADRYAGLMDTGSRLFLGHSESLHQLSTSFELHGKTIYFKK